MTAAPRAKLLLHVPASTPRQSHPISNARSPAQKHKNTACSGTLRPWPTANNSRDKDREHVLAASRAPAGCLNFAAAAAAAAAANPRKYETETTSQDGH
jgi:hypothetical protein